MNVINTWTFCDFAPFALCGASKRRKEEVAEQAEDEEADDPVDRVDVDDDHVHVKAPALGVVLKVHGVQTVASSVGELAPADGCGRPLEAWFGWKKQTFPSSGPQ